MTRLLFQHSERGAHVGENAIYRLLNSGKLKAFRNGRTWRIPKDALKEFIKEQARLR